MKIVSHVKKTENKSPSKTARKGAFEDTVFLNMAKNKKNRRFTMHKSSNCSSRFEKSLLLTNKE